MEKIVCSPAEDESAIPLFETEQSRAMRHGHCNNCCTKALTQYHKLNGNDNAHDYDIDSIDDECLDVINLNNLE